MNNKVNPKMITLARESRGLYSSDLAEIVKVTKGVASNWENERFDIGNTNLVAVSKALNYPESFFFQFGEPLPLPLSFRKRGNVTVKDLERIDALANIFRLNMEKLIEVTNPKAP